MKASLGSLIKTGIVLGFNVLMSPSPGPLAIAGGWGGWDIGPFLLSYCLLPLKVQLGGHSKPATSSRPGRGGGFSLLTLNSGWHSWFLLPR